MMSAKMATPGFHKIMAFWYKGHNIISVHDITNKILSHDSNYIIDMANSSTGTGTRYKLEILNQSGKRVKTKSQKILWFN